MPQIKTTANNVLNAHRIFMELSQKEMPRKAAYTIGRILMKVQPEIELLDKQRNDMIKELGEEDPETKQVMVKQDSPNFKTFVERYTQVLDTEIEFECPRLNLEHLGDMKLTPQMMIILDPFIQEVME